MGNAQKIENEALALNSDLANLLTEKIHLIFQSAFSIDMDFGNYKLSSPHLSKGDIYACVSMDQNDVEGALIVSFPEAAALNLVSKVYSRPMSEIDDVVKDAIGEISNIIYASIKKVLNEERGHKFQLSIPKVLLKSDLQNDALFSGYTLVLPVNFETDSFEVFINIENNKNAFIKKA